MLAIVIMNAAAGPDNNPSGNDDVMRVEAAMKKAGVETIMRAVPPKELKHAAEQAVSERPDAIVAAGGDGTINTVAGALLGKDVPMGVLPLGTYNHFAKDAGLPLDLDSAAAVIAGQVVHNVDVGRVNDRIFLNNSSIGMYPSIVKRRDQIREQLGKSKFTAMCLATMAVLRRHPLLDIRLHTSDQSILRRTAILFVGNNPYNMDLFRIGQRNSLNGGKLSVYLTHRSGRLGLLWLAVRGLFGCLNQAKDFESILLDECLIETPRRQLSVAIDGEVTLMTPPLHYRIVPGGLKLIVVRR